MRSIFWSVFSHIRTEYGEILRISVFSPNPGKYGPEKTPYLDTSHTVILILSKGLWDLHNFVCGIVKLFEKIEPKVFRFIGPGNELVKKQLNLMDSTCLKSLKETPKQHRWKIFNYYSGLQPTGLDKKENIQKCPWKITGFVVEQLLSGTILKRRIKPYINLISGLTKYTRFYYTLTRIPVFQRQLFLYNWSQSCLESKTVDDLSYFINKYNRTLCLRNDNF